MNVLSGSSLRRREHPICLGSVALPLSMDAWPVLYHPCGPQDRIVAQIESGPMTRATGACLAAHRHVSLVHNAYMWLQSARMLPPSISAVATLRGGEGV